MNVPVIVHDELGERPKATRVVGPNAALPSLVEPGLGDMHLGNRRAQNGQLTWRITHPAVVRHERLFEELEIIDIARGDDSVGP